MIFWVSPDEMTLLGEPVPEWQKPVTMYNDLHASKNRSELPSQCEYRRNLVLERRKRMELFCLRRGMFDTREERFNIATAILGGVQKERFYRELSRVPLFILRSGGPLKRGVISNSMGEVCTNFPAKGVGFENQRG